MSRASTFPTLRLSCIALAAALLCGACSDTKEERKNILRSPVQEKFADRKPLVFGVLPATSSDAVRADYEGFVARLGEIIHRRITLAIAPDYDSLIDDIAAGRVHFAQLSAYLYVRVKPSIPAEILVQQRMAWDTEYRGVFVVRNDSPYQTLRDLNGKRFAYVDKHSSAGFFYPRMTLRHLGIDPDIWFERTVFAGSHKRVAEMIRDKQVDGGVVSEQTLAEELALRVIAKTDVIPDDAIVAGSGLSDKERDALRNFFYKAHEDPKLHAFMNRRGIETYVRPDLSVYEPLEKEMGLASPVTAKSGANGAAAAAPAKGKKSHRAK